MHTHKFIALETLLLPLMLYLTSHVHFYDPTISLDHAFRIV